MVITRRILCLLAMLTSFGWGSGAFAAPGDTDTLTGTASVQIAEAVTIGNTAELAFGKLMVPTTQAAVATIEAQTGARTGNAGAVFAATDDFSPAIFTLTIPARTRILITTLSPVILLTGPGLPLRVDQLTESFNGARERDMPRRERVPNNGEATLQIGGRLTVPVGQRPGKYRGEFLVIATHL